MMEEEVSNEIHHSVIPPISFLHSWLRHWIAELLKFCPRCLKLGHASSLYLIILSVELHCSNDCTNSKESFSKKPAFALASAMSWQAWFEGSGDKRCWFTKSASYCFLHALSAAAASQDCLLVETQGVLLRYTLPYRYIRTVVLRHSCPPFFRLTPNWSLSKSGASL